MVSCGTASLSDLVLMSNPCCSSTVQLRSQDVWDSVSELENYCSYILSTYL